MYLIKYRVPDAVVINLGTNDFSGLADPQSIANQYKEAYIMFIYDINDKYKTVKTPAFFLACGPISDVYCEYVLEVIEYFNYKDISVDYLNHSIPYSDDELCCGHPSRRMHEKMADIATLTISNNMKWEI